MRAADPLGNIVAAVRKDLKERKAAEPFSGIEARARANRGRRDIRDLLGEGPGIIAEIKRASPSRGWIRKDLDAAGAARSYARGGACAVSVLTESRFFGGTLRDLSDASAACGDLPVLRKDFVLDEYMVVESRAYGADLVLLIVSVLGEKTGKLVRLAEEFGMEALVEVHDEAEMEIAAGSGAAIVGINNRDLASLRVDLGTAARLLPKAPPSAVKVVESGITSRAEVRRFHEMGADAFLVGEAIVRSADAANAIRRLKHGVYNKRRGKERIEWKRRSS
ncbi:MAG TPA: indole-3-glycerol phosphate synthase TrpC [Candidatus Deferrimicrobiaceae bacterium]|nr:indole-3-glycerol phosphate synthase TrpC [Candidatus Deferrimicrobiaceae bacterium]